MTIRSKAATKAYRDGWERVFGKKPEPIQIRVRPAIRCGPIPTLEVHGAKPSAIRERKP